jgi:bacillithiol biosynthesis deacetylase BshB1
MPEKKLDMLIFGAHPDDAEIGMGGTVIKHAEAGWKVGICDLTLAEMSSNGDVETRQKEAAKAAEILGLTVRTTLRLPDRGLGLFREQIELITLEIRKFKPKVVFAPYWEDRHPDHVMCSKMVTEAVFNAKLRKMLPDTESWQVQQFYYYYINDAGRPDLLVDVSGQYERKMDALRAYASQFDDVGKGEDRVATPLTDGYVERVAARDRLFGQLRAVQYAEGFAVKVPYMVDLFR